MEILLHPWRSERFRQAHPLQALSSRLRFATEAPSWAAWTRGEMCQKWRRKNIWLVYGQYMVSIWLMMMVKID